MSTRQRFSISLAELSRHFSDLADEPSRSTAAERLRHEFHGLTAFGSHASDWAAPVDEALIEAAADNPTLLAFIHAMHGRMFARSEVLREQLCALYEMLRPSCFDANLGFLNDFAAALAKRVPRRNAA